MQARKLRALLNDTKYIICGTDEYIAVGSSLCHDLISVNRKTKQIRYALDTFNKGRESLSHKDVLGDIWDKLQLLIDSGEIQEIMDGADVLENQLPVYAVIRREIIETTTDAYGWPNVTVDGTLMNNGCWFPTKAEALKDGIEYANDIIARTGERVLELAAKIDEQNNISHQYLVSKEQLETLLNAS